MRPANAALVAALVVATANLAGCAPIDPQPREPVATVAAPVALPPIVATERGRRGGRLVFIKESGERILELTKTGPVAVRDNSPAWSPDGRWVVFASSRGRDSLMQTSLWIVAAQADAQPRRLTFGQADERDPVWLPDSTGVVFSSNRNGTFDLWRLDLTMGRYGWPVPAEVPEPITDSSRHALHPSVAPDGERIVYSLVDVDSGRSELWLWARGTSTQLTAGPGDATPAWSPDGRAIAFSALVSRQPEAEAVQPRHNAPPIPDADLFVIDADGANRRHLVDETLAVQTDPVWSPDGRYLFSTSLFRSARQGKPVLSSVTFVDLQEQPPVLRALHDPSVVESRTGPTLAQQTLDEAALRSNQPYATALMRAVEQRLIQYESAPPPAQPRSESQR